MFRINLISKRYKDAVMDLSFVISLGGSQGTFIYLYHHSIETYEASISVLKASTLDVFFRAGDNKGENRPCY